MSVIYTVPEKHCVIVKRFNEFSRVQKAGIRFQLPVIESFHQVPEWENQAVKNNIFIELMEQQTDTRPRETQTKDNAIVSANASVYWRIQDPVKACFNVDRLPQAMSDTALNALRSNIGRLELDEVLSERARLNNRIQKELYEATENWGVKIRRVEIQELTTDSETRDSMRQQMDAERKRRAKVAEAEGKSEYEIKVAEALKEAAIKKAEGEAKALQKLAKAEKQYLEALKEEVPPEQAAQILISQKYINGFESISENESDKVFLPNNFQALLNMDTET